jgi:transposase
LRHVSNEGVFHVAKLSPVSSAAAAIDIGANMHVAAVGPDRDEQPVRTLRTFTEDLQRLADWFVRCGIRTIVMESTGVYFLSPRS